MEIFHPGMSFEEFALEVCRIPDNHADPHFKSQYLFLTDWKRQLVVDYVGYFENFEEDCQFAFSRIGVSDLELPHLLKSKRRPYEDYYTPRLREMVAQRYGQDIRIFGYEFAGRKT